MTRDKCYDWQHLLDTYKNIAHNEMVVLEVGSSNVERTTDLAKHCKELIGVEKFSERIPNDSAFPNHNVRIVKGDWSKLSEVIPLNSVDIVIASHVIEHVEDDLKCINESYKILKKGGYLLFNTPNRKRLPRSIIETFTGERKFPWWEHIREYVRSDLEKLISNSFFESDKSSILGLGFGLHGYAIYKHGAPNILDKFVNFWEVLVKK